MDISNDQLAAHLQTVADGEKEKAAVAQQGTALKDETGVDKNVLREVHNRIAAAFEELRKLISGE